MNNLRCVAAIYSAAVLLFPMSIGFAGAVRVAGGEKNTSAADKIVKTDKSEVTISVLDEKEGEVREFDIEEYLVGVLAAEMPATYETEALKAQAVAARSYIMSRMGVRTAEHPTADVCTSSAHCKAWLSEYELSERFGEKTDEYIEKFRGAVAATLGEYMEYEGEVVEAFFFASSGGRTENPAEVWGGSRPYLKSVSSEVEAFAAELDSRVSVAAAEFDSVMIGAGAGRECGIGAITRTEGGSVAEIEIGGKVFRGTEIRRLFGLKSANFTVQKNGENIVFSVKGSGHGVGMSQFGANLMAKQGKKYTEILAHYYTNIQIVKK